MPKLYAVLAFAALSTVTIFPAHAQQDARVGLGVGLSSAAFGGGDFDVVESFLSPTSIYVPITFSTFRLEPEIGLFRLSSEDENSESTTTSLQIGTGVFAIRSVDRTNLYYGGRVGVTRLSSSFEGPIGDDESSRLNFFVGPAAGGEFVFGEHFSLGGEGQLLYTSIGDDDDGVDESASVIRTRAIFFVRWHL